MILNTWVAISGSHLNAPLITAPNATCTHCIRTNMNGFRWSFWCNLPFRMTGIRWRGWGVGEVLFSRILIQFLESDAAWSNSLSVASDSKSVFMTKRADLNTSSGEAESFTRTSTLRMSIVTVFSCDLEVPSSAPLETGFLLSAYVRRNNNRKICYKNARSG